MNKWILLLSISSLFITCADSPSLQETSETTVLDTTIEREVNTIKTRDTIQALIPNDETSELTDINENVDLAAYLSDLSSNMENITSPVRMVFDGSDFGDYFHLSFSGPKDSYLDFGDGNNDFGEFELYDRLTFEDNPKYVGKTFDIYWEYKTSTFACCEGNMEAVTAKVPSIVKLKLIEK